MAWKFLISRRYELGRGMDRFHGMFIRVMLKQIAHCTASSILAVASDVGNWPLSSLGPRMIRIWAVFLDRWHSLPFDNISLDTF